MRNNKWRNKVGNPKRGWHSECLKHRHTHTHFKTDQTGKCRWHCRSMEAAVRGLNFNLPSDVQAKVLGDESNVIQWPYIHVVGFKSKWPIYIFIYTYMEYYSSMLLQMVKFYPSNNMDELERYFTKWNRSDRERQILNITLPCIILEVPTLVWNYFKTKLPTPKKCSERTFYKTCS